MTGTSAMPEDEANKPGDDFLGLLCGGTDLGDISHCQLTKEDLGDHDVCEATAPANESLGGDGEDSGDKKPGSEEEKTIPGDEEDSGDKKPGTEEATTIPGDEKDSSDKKTDLEEEETIPGNEKNSSDEKDSSDKKQGSGEDKTIYGDEEDSGDEKSSSEEEKTIPELSHSNLAKNLRMSTREEASSDFLDQENFGGDRKDSDTKSWEKMVSDMRNKNLRVKAKVTPSICSILTNYSGATLRDVDRTSASVTA